MVKNIGCVFSIRWLAYRMGTVLDQQPIEGAGVTGQVAGTAPLHHSLVVTRGVGLELTPSVVATLNTPTSWLSLLA